MQVCLGHPLSAFLDDPHRPPFSIMPIIPSLTHSAQAVVKAAPAGVLPTTRKNVQVTRLRFEQDSGEGVVVGLTLLLFCPHTSDRLQHSWGWHRSRWFRGILQWPQGQQRLHQPSVVAGAGPPPPTALEYRHPYQC